MRALSVLCLIALSLCATPVSSFDSQLWSSFPNMNQVTSLAEGDDQIFVGTTGGIRRYDRFRDRWLRPITTLQGLPDSRIRRLAYDVKSGDLWFDTAAGTGRWLSRLETVSMFSGEPPPFHLRPRIPPLVPPFGYFLQDGWIRGPRRTYEVTDALIDSWRVLWLGTWGLGVGRADMRDEQLTFLPYGPLSENVTAIARDGDHVWFGGGDSYRAASSGISRFAPKTGVWDYFIEEDIVGLDQAHINTILPDSSCVWFGSREGLVRYTRSTDQWLTYRVGRGGRAGVTGLARDKNRLWIGTSTGLAVFDIAADSIRSVAGSQLFVINGLSAGPGFIWAATDNGLFQCPRGDVTWRQVDSPNGLARRPTSAVADDGAVVWAVLDSPPSLIRWAHTDTAWHRVALSEAGGNNRIGLAAHSGRVWVGTASGAMRFDAGSQLWHRYTSFDGLLDDRVQAVLLDGEYVWFGTATGASRFHWAMAF